MNGSKLPEDRDAQAATKSKPWVLPLSLAATCFAFVAGRRTRSGRKTSTFGPGGNSFNDGSAQAKRGATSRPHGGGSGLHERALEEFESFVEPEENLAAHDGSGKGGSSKIEHARGNSGTPRLRHRDPDEKQLNGADDRVDFQTWPPPRKGRMPEIRIGKWWVNCMWIVPIAALGLIGFIALSQTLRETAWWQGFVALYPGQPLAAPKVATGYPWWLRLQHYVYIVFMFFIIRAGTPLVDYAAGVVSFWGDGDRPIEVTTVEDTARIAARVALDRDVLAGKFTFWGDRRSFDDVARTAETLTGRPFERRSLGDEAALRAAMAAADPAVAMMLAYSLYMANGQTSMDVQMAERYPEVVLRKLEDMLADRLPTAA